MIQVEMGDDNTVQVLGQGHLVVCYEREIREFPLSKTTEIIRAAQDSTKKIVIALPHPGTPCAFHSQA